jgi:hypothetical protein
MRNTWLTISIHAKAKLKMPSVREITGLAQVLSGCSFAITEPRIWPGSVGFRCVLAFSIYCPITDIDIAKVSLKWFFE